MENKYDITVIGAAVIDVLASPADRTVFDTGSAAMNTIRLSFGGDALNEAVALSRMGKRVRLISKIGDDEAGHRILDYMKENGIAPDSINVQTGLDTAVNIVLIDQVGERHFLTNPCSSLRSLDLPDIEPYLENAGSMISLASMFVSPKLTIEKMTYLFRKIKAQGHLLFADMTKAKCGESLDDIRPLLAYADVIAPNAAEAALLTGVQDPYENVRLFLDAGVKTVIIKCGAAGCIVGEGTDVYAVGTGQNTDACETAGAVQSAGSTGNIYAVPAVPGIRCVDSTGAGDAFAAGFLAGLSERKPIRDCARLGCAAASCAIEQVGAVEGILSDAQIRQRVKLI